MSFRGRWVAGPILAVLLSACGPTGSALTPAPAAPTAATAVVGAGTPTSSVAAPGAPVTRGVPPTSAQTSTPSSTARATTRPTAAPTPRPTAVPTPRPTGTPRPATPAPATPPLGTVGEAVRIADFAFTPATTTVAVGTRVTWTNRQPDIQHTVTADDGSFGSKPLSTGSSFSHVFTIAGTYSYHCSIHTDMTGTVIVTG